MVKLRAHAQSSLWLSLSDHFDSCHQFKYTLTAVARSTQPSTLCGTVKWVSAFGLSNNNKWRWWVWLLAAYRWTHNPGRLAWGSAAAWRRAIFIIWAGWTLTVALGYDDSTINIVVVTIIILLWWLLLLFIKIKVITNRLQWLWRTNQHTKADITNTMLSHSAPLLL